MIAFLEPQIRNYGLTMGLKNVKLLLMVPENIQCRQQGLNIFQKVRISECVCSGARLRALVPGPISVGPLRAQNRLTLLYL